MADLSMAVPVPITAVASSSSPASLFVVASGSSLLVHSGSSTQAIPSSSTSTSTTADQLIPLVRHIAISADSAHIATASDDKLLRVYSITGGKCDLVSTRPTSKKCSDLSFAPSTSDAEPHIVFSDKVGDVYLYPYTPRTPTGTRPTPLALQSDPTLNPDADFLLGHVSVLTASVLTPCGKYIITSDRDEHIRVSRFPKSFIIERYLFGSDAFISALHIPESSPGTLISAGGEQWLRIWDWTTGKAVGKVDIYPAVLPHRRARSNMRRVKKRHNNKREGAEESAGAAGTAEPASDEMSEGSFYVAPEGYTLPSGQGVCVKKIRTVTMGEQTFVVFFSEGAAAIHSFPLSLDSASAPPTISTLPLDFPVLDFTVLPSSSSSSSPQVAISLDSTWGILKQNPPAGSQTSTITPPSITSECTAKMSAAVVVAEISSDGLALVPQHPILESLSSEYVTAPGLAVSKLQLYPLLPLLPRWPGMEEDDELAGPAAAAGPSTNTEAPVPEGEGGEIVEGKKDYTHEELSLLNNKMLGRLKAQGVEVDEYLRKKNRRPRGGVIAKKRRLIAGRNAEEEEEGEEDGEEVDAEAQMNEA